MNNSIETREKTIIRTSIVGILGNIVLAVFKAIVGLVSNSIAVTLDAVNNLSDAASSVITIVATKLSGKAPDKKHPFGYGRIEYISSMIVAALVLYAGITSLVESVKKIITPETPDYSAVTIIILVAAIVVKLLLGTYVKAKGKEVNSGSLAASGTDAFNDAVLSSSVLASAVIFLLWGVSLEAYVGVVIAGFIIKSGIEMISESVSDILGQRSDPELSKKLKDIVTSEKEVLGAYDLILNNYGSDRYIASLHIEVDSETDAVTIDALTRRLQEKVYRETGVLLAAVGIYASASSDNSSSRIRSDIMKTVMSYDGVMQLHGFFLDEKSMKIVFDIVIDYAVSDRKELYGRILSAVQEKYPDYSVNIALDSDFSD